MGFVDFRSECLLSSSPLAKDGKEESEWEEELRRLFVLYHNSWFLCVMNAITARGGWTIIIVINERLLAKNASISLSLARSVSLSTLSPFLLPSLSHPPSLPFSYKSHSYLRVGSQRPCEVKLRDATMRVCVLDVILFCFSPIQCTLR